MKKVFVILVCLMMQFSLTAQPANAAKVSFKIGNWFTGTVESVVSYKGSECKSIKVSYVVDKGLRWPYQFVSLSLDQKSNTELAYATIKPGDEDPYKGVKTLEICQSSREVLVDEDCDPDYEESIGSECEYETVAGIKPGSYTLGANMTQIKPFVFKSSNKVKITVKK